MNSRNHTLGTTIKTQISGSETFCSFSGSCHLPLIKMGCWGNGIAWHSVSPARQTLSIWSDHNMHLEEHRVENMVVNSCELSYLYNIFSSRNKKKSNKTVNPVKFRKTNCIFWNICNVFTNFIWSTLLCNKMKISLWRARGFIFYWSLSFFL